MFFSSLEYSEMEIDAKVNRVNVVARQLAERSAGFHLPDRKKL